MMSSRFVVGGWRVKSGHPKLITGGENREAIFQANDSSSQTAAAHK
jgi:hypothetical protein